MTSENQANEQNDHASGRDPAESSTPAILDPEQTLELNSRVRNDFMSYCYSFLQDNEEAHQCVQIVWNKYLQCVGDVAILSAFFDTLPFSTKKSVLPKYHYEIVQWCQELFHMNSDALLCSTFYSETFQRVIRYALKPDQDKKAVIYISMDFDATLKTELTSVLSNIKFEYVSNDSLLEDMIDINRLEEAIKRDFSDPQSFPFMVIANAGSALLGHCDQLARIKRLCEPYDIWLHVIGDLLGSLSLLSNIKENVNMNCDSLTIDTMKLFGVQNLPYLTLFLRSINDIKQIDDKKALVPSHPLYEFILNSPSISFLTIWSLSQRCSNDIVLSHMKQAFDSTSLLFTQLKTIKNLRILNDIDEQDIHTFERICSGDAPNSILPKSVIVFRFQPTNISEFETMDDMIGYVDLLNLWLFDKLSQQYPKMNLELLKSVHFQIAPSSEAPATETPAHAIRFAPLEHLIDIIDQADMKSFIEDLKRYSDILLATMTGRLNLPLMILQFDNLVSVPIPNWAGVGAIRYVPAHLNSLEVNETFISNINNIQAELARQLQTNDSAFSLGRATDDIDSMFYLRLGMIKKFDDLETLLQKILDAGRETEASLKYVEDMAEKIRQGIEKAQRDLQEEDLQILSQEGILRQLPLVSSIMSWWSPAPTSTNLAKKGRSFDLNSGRIESTEDTYIYRMQINKQSPHAPTHDNQEQEKVDDDTKDKTENPTELTNGH